MYPTAESIALLDNTKKLQDYYKFHSKIYDLTRWAFLFGRKKIVSRIPLLNNEVKSILEVGCGTGHNLVLLASKYPKAKIIGIDISSEMVEKSKIVTSMYPNVTVLQTSSVANEKFDVVMISYVLTMLNPGWDFWITAPEALLSKNGVLAIVDFHYSPFSFFSKHMGNHNVKMNAHLLTPLKKQYNTFYEKVEPAYFGLWSYFSFIGKVKNQSR